MDERRIGRRTWLGTIAAASTGVACAAAGRFAQAIEPVERVGGPKFKFSLAAYSYRDLLTAKPPRATIEDFIRDCAALQLDATELTSYYLPPEPSADELYALRRLCFRLGLDVSGTAVRNDFCLPAGDKREQDIAHVKHWVDYAAMLGAPVIRIFSGNAHEGQSESEARQLAVAAIEECCAYAGRHGVTLALENHGGLTTTADGLLAIVEAVKSPWFGVNLDTGNFHSADVYGDLARLAPYAVNVQVKVVIKPENGPKQPADFARIARILRDANYRGYVVLEYEESEDPRVACPRFISELRAAFA